jgi:SAM-dependent methyltransferase
MNTQEIHQFFNAFSNSRANTLVKKMMIHNHAEAIMEHHPLPRQLVAEEVFQQCSQLSQTIFDEIERVKSTPENLPALLRSMAKNGNPPSPIWFDSFRAAYHNYKHHRKLQHKMEHFAPYMQGANYCDIGCGGGDLVAFVKDYFPQFQSYTGIDVLDWRTETLKNEIDFQMIDFSNPGTRSQLKYDMATCIAVLHHVGNTDESQEIFLRNVRESLTETGRLLIEEDVLLPHEEIERDDGLLQQVGNRIIEQPYLSEYLALNEASQKDVLTLIDLLANTLIVGVQEMAFPFGFKSINKWMQILTNSGFRTEDVQIKGFTPGLFNRSSHVLFVVQPN